MTAWACHTDGKRMKRDLLPAYRAMETLIGTIYSTNITPDKKLASANTAEDFDNAVQGRSQKCSICTGDASCSKL